VYLVHVVEFGGEAAVHAEDFAVHDGGDGQAVEAVGEGLGREGGREG